MIAERAPALAAFAAALTLVSFLGCATLAHNFRDLSGPKYSGSFAATGGPGAITDTNRVRVVTFNIQHSMRVPGALEALKAHAPLRNPDLLLLQEMDSAAVDTIARVLRLNYVYYPASIHPHTQKLFGNAVMSPWPIEASRKVLLPHPSRVIEQQRVAVAVRVRIAGRHVRAYSVHLGSPSGIGPAARKDQARAVLADAIRSPDPVIIGGDMNSYGVGWTYVEGGFTWATAEIGRTSSRFSIDHVFARGFSPYAGRQAGVVRDVHDVSDHLPVWAEFVFAPAAAPAAASAPAGS
ncbi:MAG: endonuclease/exonuclease/phosphatase family protein [Candidatus Eiseniibacteriota bacterium]